MRRRTPIPDKQKLVDRSLPRILIYDFHQDDPKKCTAAKLEKFRLAIPLRSIRQIPPRAIVLNPMSNQTLSLQDRSLIQQYGLVGIDCSWNLADSTLDGNLKGENRRLPTLLAGNPTNYSARGKLSTAEAVVAALIITGFDQEAMKIIKIFKWGETFLSLNKEPLFDYARTPPEHLAEREREYFPVD